MHPALAAPEQAAPAFEAGYQWQQVVPPHGIWLRLPGAEEWLLADVCRSARKMAVALLPTAAQLATRHRAGVGI